MAADYSVDGEIPTISGRTIHALFLALRKRETDNAVQSLVVPAAEYQPAKRLRLVASKTSQPIRFGRLLEQQPDWVWATVESADHTQPMPSVDSILGAPPLVPPAAANE